VLVAGASSETPTWSSYGSRVLPFESVMVLEGCCFEVPGKAKGSGVGK